VRRPAILGARLVGHLGKGPNEPRGARPAVVIDPGFGDADITYTGLLEQVAKDGRLVDLLGGHE
jgi:hypothetical protein